MLCYVLCVCYVMLCYTFISNSISQTVDREPKVFGGAFVWVVTLSAVFQFVFQGNLKSLSLLRILNIIKFYLLDIIESGLAFSFL